MVHSRQNLRSLAPGPRQKTQFENSGNCIQPIKFRLPWIGQAYCINDKFYPLKDNYFNVYFKLQLTGYKKVDIV